jgi:hypothetical protein
MEAPPGKEKILKRDDSMIKISIPALTVYKTLLKMRDVQLYFFIFRY